MDCQKTVGKESASIGQGKALRAGWVSKDRDMLKAKVRYGYLYYITVTDCEHQGRFNNRCESRAAADYTKHSNIP